MPNPVAQSPRHNTQDLPLVNYLSKLSAPGLYKLTLSRLQELPLQNQQSRQQLFHDALLDCYWLSVRSAASYCRSEEILLRMPADAAQALIKPA